MVLGMEFDASIDLMAAHLPDGVEPTEAVARVCAAEEALPGAGWISVEWRGDCPPVRWLRLYRRHCSGVMDGGAWDDLRANIERTVSAVLSSPA